MARLTHMDEQGRVRMVDTGQKPVARRLAIAQSVIRLSPETFGQLAQGGLPKGDALGCARIGAILAAKQTANLIPLCHSLPLSKVDINFELDEDAATIRILAEARCSGQTGVEMEAIVAAQTAAAIIYDMAKAIQRDMEITDTKLLYKSGGKSGEFCAPDFSLENYQSKYGSGADRQNI